MQKNIRKQARLLAEITRDFFINVPSLLKFALFMISSYLSTAKIKINRFQMFLVGFLLFTLLFVILQKYFISKGIYFGLPVELFIMNQGTLADLEIVLSNETRLRATSFYGEPSYTSWIVFSILTILLLQNKIPIKIKYFSIIICLLIVILSESLSGILGIFIFVIIWFLKTAIKTKNIKLIFSFLIISIIILLLMVNFSNEFQDRIFNISKNTDQSFSGRMLDPFNLIPKMSGKEILIGMDKFHFSDSSEIFIDNAAWSLIIRYGFLSIVIFGVIWKFIKNKMLLLYFFIVLSFNGSIFSYDKIIVTSLVLGVSTCYSNQKNKRKVVILNEIKHIQYSNT